jgi:hypothetical protein
LTLGEIFGEIAVNFSCKQKGSEGENPIAIVALVVAIDEDIFLFAFLVLRRFSL